MLRRGFLAALLAPFLARFAPKPKLTVFHEIEAKMAGARMRMANILAANFYTQQSGRTVFCGEDGIWELGAGGEEFKQVGFTLWTEEEYAGLRT